MEINKALEETRRVLRANGLEDWEVKPLRTTRVAGRTWHGKKTIGLSKSLTENRSDNEVQNTITHEVAHAIIGKSSRPHGWKWKEKHRGLGGNGSRCWNR